MCSIGSEHYCFVRIKYNKVILMCWPLMHSLLFWNDQWEGCLQSFCLHRRLRIHDSTETFLLWVFCPIKCCSQVVLKNIYTCLFLFYSEQAPSFSMCILYYCQCRRSAQLEINRLNIQRKCLTSETLGGSQISNRYAFDTRFDHIIW